MPISRHRKKHKVKVAEYKQSIKDARKMHEKLMMQLFNEAILKDKLKTTEVSDSEIELTPTEEVL